jgi:hypothetical protein
MRLRGFLACYLGAVVIIGGVGASAYQGLQHRHAAMEALAKPKPVAVAEATTEATPPPAPLAAAAVTPPAPVVAAAPPTARALPKLRPHVATAVASNPKPWPRVAHGPARQPPRTAHNEVARNEPPMYQPQPYSPPPEIQYYASPAHYPYGGYYGGYGYYPPRYGYYRSY